MKADTELQLARPGSMASWPSLPRRESPFSPALYGDDGEEETLIAMLGALFAEHVDIFSPERLAVIAAHRLVLVMDERFGHVFMERFIRTVPPDGLLLEPGAVVPVARPPFKEWFGHLSTEPHNLEQKSLLRRCVRLVPQSTEPVRVRLVIGPAVQLGRASKGRPTIAVARLQQKLDELEWDGLPPGKEPPERFINVHPRQPKRHHQRLWRTLHRADKLGSDIVVLPELSVRDIDVARIVRWMRRPERAVRILVAGSVHVRDGDGWRNRSTMIIGGGVVTHDKFNPFMLHGAREHIATEPAELKLVLIPKWSVTTRHL